MSKVNLVSVIVTTYNWSSALAMVLQSLIDQKDRHFEIVIADDGSDRETRDLIEKFARRSPVPVHHFWQKDSGFRVARARNGALSMCHGDLVLFIDGDCCVMPDFIARHRQAATQGCFVTGKRVFLKRRFTDLLLRTQLAFHKWPRAALFGLGLTGQCNRPFQFVPMLQTDKGLWKHENCWKKAQTCNLAVFRSDIDRVAGFDESYEGHGMEDSDFVLRLLRSGLRRKNLEYSSPVLHLFHGRKIAQRHAGSDNNGVHFKNLEQDATRFLPGKSMFLSPEAAE
ncbi:glycosyltransferase [Thalassospira sp.]|uniref:glycosyltransferase n=1 Tax=Thalassospira sp. TaxID=1912094 RepID=UPI003AA86D3D